MPSSKVTDFLQGARNCPPDIIPYHCSNCSIKDERSSRFRNALKPRCAEPNFAGTAVLEGVNDKGFDHENIRIAFNPSLAPPFYCVCGRYDLGVTFTQEDKYHFPQIALQCKCGRRKVIILHCKLETAALTGAWISPRSCKNEWDLPKDERSKMDEQIACKCKRKQFAVYYERGGYAYFPREGETVLLQCKKCDRYKKVSVRGGVDTGEPWVGADTEARRAEIVVRTSTDMCPDERTPGELEKVFVVSLAKK